MAEGTRISQLTKAVAANKEDINHHTELLKTLVEKVSDLAITVASISQNQIQNNLTQNQNNQPQNQTQDNQNSKILRGEGSKDDSKNMGEKEEGQGSHNEREWGYHTQTVKLDFPRFDGTEPITWILKAQQFFSYSHTPENQKVQIAAFHMEGRALTWYHWLMDAGQTGGWEEFVVALKTRFAPSAFDDPVGVFTKLIQTSSIEDYQTQFEILSNRIQGMSEEFKVSTFLCGLKEEVRIMVTMMKPTALTTTFGLAKLQEEKVKLRSRGQKYQSWVSNSQRYTKLAAPPNPPRIIAPNQPENRNTNPPYNTNFNRRPSIPIKRLTPA
jgi:hypothetical protein